MGLANKKEAKFLNTYIISILKQRQIGFSKLKFLHKRRKSKKSLRYLTKRNEKNVPLEKIIHLKGRE